ncbi:DUF2490 domain-containing protein [Flagellimonas allohymeniacidonis]|nr:DUF2490 domain-containing protein [Allomuricauda hymeniacidonis]
MSCTKRLPLLLVALCCLGVRAQDNLTAFFQPQAAVNYNVSQTYGHNFSLAYRSFFIDEGVVEYQSRQLDLAHFSKFKIKGSQSIAFGVQYRFRDIFDDGANELRFMQQFNTTSRPMIIRFGHRLRAEQRITRARTIHRFRYRFALDFPLQGEKLDLGEAYFVGGFENLLSITQSRSSQYDTRLSGQIGWQLDKGFKFQMGIEYRLEDYTSSLPQNVVFLLSSAQLSL